MKFCFDFSVKLIEIKIGIFRKFCNFFLPQKTQEIFEKFKYFSEKTSTSSKRSSNGHEVSRICSSLMLWLEKSIKLLTKS